MSNKIIELNKGEVDFVSGGLVPEVIIGLVVLFYFTPRRNMDFKSNVVKLGGYVGCSAVYFYEESKYGKAKESDVVWGALVTGSLLYLVL